MFFVWDSRWTFIAGDSSCCACDEPLCKLQAGDLFYAALREFVMLKDTQHLSKNLSSMAVWLQKQSLLATVFIQKDNGEATLHFEATAGRIFFLKHCCIRPPAISPSNKTETSLINRVYPNWILMLVTHRIWDEKCFLISSKRVQS